VTRRAVGNLSEQVCPTPKQGTGILIQLAVVFAVGAEAPSQGFALRAAEAHADGVPLATLA
jgi:hypothetical protein